MYDDPLVQKRPSELGDVGIRHKAELGDGLADTFLDQSFVIVSFSIGRGVGVLQFRNANDHAIELLQARRDPRRPRAGRYLLASVFSQNDVGAQL